MKIFFKCLLVALVCFLGATSCFDDDYDWENLDKTGRFNLPVVPLGSFDTVRIAELPIIPLPPGIEVPVGNFYNTYSDTIKGLFNEDVSKTFFDKDKDTDVKISGKLAGKVLPDAQFIKVTMKFELLKEDKTKLPVVIPIQKIEYINNGTVPEQNINSELEIAIKKEYMKYMPEARHMLVSIVIHSQLSLSVLPPKTYLVWNELKLYPGSVAFEL